MTRLPFRRATLTALVFTALAATAVAETAPPGGPPGGQPRADRPNMRMRMPMGGMQHMLGLAELRPGMKIEYSEGRLAFLKAELKITDAQTKAWDAFAAALRDNATKLNEVFGGADREAISKMSPPERLGWQEKALGAQIDALKRARAAFDPLYAALSDDQKKTFDRLVPTGGRFAQMRERMRDRMHNRMERRGQQGQPPAPGQPGQPQR